MPHISERQDALRAIREAITVTVLAQAVTEMAERNGVVGGSAGGVAEVVAGALRFDPDPDQEEETIDLLAETHTCSGGPTAHLENKKRLVDEGLGEYAG